MTLPRLFLIGDSISVHYTPYLQKHLAGLFTCIRHGTSAEALKNLDIPKGGNAGDSTRALTFISASRSVGGLGADLLLINCGLHDIKHEVSVGKIQVPIDLYRENLKSIAKVVGEMKIPILWARTTLVVDEIHNTLSTDFHRFEKHLDAYNAVADDVMRSAGATVVDLYTFTKNLGPDLFCDHVHYHEPIREKQAAFLAGAVLATWERVKRQTI